MTDPLDDLADRLERLPGEPVAAHPAVLDEVHRALTSELDAVGGVAGAGTPTAEG